MVIPFLWLLSTWLNGMKEAGLFLSTTTTKINSLNYKSNMRHILEAVWTRVLTEVGVPGPGFPFPIHGKHFLWPKAPGSWRSRQRPRTSMPQQFQWSKAPEPKFQSQWIIISIQKTWKFPNRNPSGKFPTGFFLDIRDLPRELFEGFFTEQWPKKNAWPYSALFSCVGPKICLVWCKGENELEWASVTSGTSNWVTWTGSTLPSFILWAQHFAGVTQGKTESTFECNGLAP